jgi:hypothetical protein
LLEHYAPAAFEGMKPCIVGLIYVNAEYLNVAATFRQ